MTNYNSNQLQKVNDWDQPIFVESGGEMTKSNSNHEIAPFISEKCPNGNFLLCSVCSIYDIDERKFGLVKMRNYSWLEYIKDHLTSMRHKDNFLKKTNHEEDNKRRRLNDEKPPKLMKKSVLSFASSNPTEKQTQSHIFGGVLPAIASGDTIDLSFHEEIQTRNNNQTNATEFFLIKTLVMEH